MLQVKIALFQTFQCKISLFCVWVSVVLFWAQTRGGECLAFRFPFLPNSSSRWHLGRFCDLVGLVLKGPDPADLMLVPLEVPRSISMPRGSLWRCSSSDLPSVLSTLKFMDDGAQRWFFFFCTVKTPAWTHLTSPWLCGSTKVLLFLPDFGDPPWLLGP